MARIVLDICDYCKNPENATAKITLKHQASKEVTHGVICSQCYADILFKLTKPYTPPEHKSQPKTRNIEDGVNIVESAGVVKAGVNKPAKCTHDKTSYEHPYAICKDCGEKWLVK